jgi:hypothetical protein
VLKPTTLAIAWLALVANAPSPALGQEIPSEENPRFETSYDSLVIVELGKNSDLLSEPRLPEGGATLFASTPDWSNTLRRQVGGVVAADMNGDDQVDLVVGCYNSSAFPPYDDWHNMIYYNTGSELEAAPSWISNDEVSTGEVKMADFNNDTFPDVFAANGGRAMAPSRIYFGSATGPSTTASWSEAGGSTWTNYAQPFDFDHDGDIDLATANQGNSQFDPTRPMRLFLNDAGTLATVPAWSSDESSLQNFLSWGDLNGDGWEDLAVSKWINYESAVYLSVDDPGGTRTLEGSPSWTTGEDGDDKGIGFADIDGMNGPDLALGHDPTQAFLHDGTTLAKPAAFTATGTFFGHSDLKWGDVDGDGDPDLAEIHFANGTANLYLNEGGVLNSTPVWSYDSSAVGTALDFGDINGDGALDLILAYAGDPATRGLSNLGRRRLSSS